MSEQVSIQWFPGHMAKTRRLIKESLPLVDCVAEIVDARIPLSSRNPELEALCAEKPRIFLLNKIDLADPSVTDKWVEYIKKNGAEPLAVDCKSGRGLNRFLPLVRELLKEKINRNIEKGMAGRKIRIMTAGIPNCGKSTFINKMAGSKRLKAEDRPGVTRGKQWIDLGGGIEMMDTPGILWPKFEDTNVGENLAFCGSVKDEVIDMELLARRILEKISVLYPDLLRARYKLSGDLPGEGAELLNLVGKKRGMLISGGEVDTERAAVIVLDEFRSGKIGRISLEE
ncbi:MAG TPA: ribosome biogenesis GTPase YlqF, partial [Ruminiclostridium sp.]|nr:ribosome biogenesis GTPase YlqF [Ruminiclostridium sp.]